MSKRWVYQYDDGSYFRYAGSYFRYAGECSTYCPEYKTNSLDSAQDIDDPKQAEKSHPHWFSGGQWVNTVQTIRKEEEEAVVYVVLFYNFGDQGTAFMGVFSSEEKAQAYINSKEPDENERQYWDIEECFIDELGALDAN